MAWRKKKLRDLAWPGDLLFYRVTPGSSLLARVIASLQLLRGEGAGAVQYSHVAILDEDTDFCLEAKWPRVCISEVDWSSTELELWRMPLNSKDVPGLLAAAHGMVGEWYDIVGLLLGALDSRHRQICTTFVRRAFATIGVEMGAGSGKILTPNELAADPAIHRIGK